MCSQKGLLLLGKSCRCRGKLIHLTSKVDRLRTCWPKIFPDIEVNMFLDRGNDVHSNQCTYHSRLQCNSHNCKGMWCLCDMVHKYSCLDLPSNLEDMGKCIDHSRDTLLYCNFDN